MIDEKNPSQKLFVIWTNLRNYGKKHKPQFNISLFLFHLLEGGDS